VNDISLWSPKIKFCGLVREQDVQAAVALGVHAIGFVFYEKSPRYLSLAQAKALRSAIPAHILAVGLFVNASRCAIATAVREVGLDVVQFHGDESAQELEQWSVPVWRAVRMQSAQDVQQARQQFPSAQHYLLDAHVDTYGGAGKTFDWELVRANPAASDGTTSDLILSGGLTVDNVAAGIKAVLPAWVDVSSGVQGLDARQKDLERMTRFISAVRLWNSGIA
jgi:phosphoribosylanthranilate isomerase